MSTFFSRDGEAQIGSKVNIKESKTRRGGGDGRNTSKNNRVRNETFARTTRSKKTEGTKE